LKMVHRFATAKQLQFVNLLEMTQFSEAYRSGNEIVLG
jgi:hypothetical protein